MEFGILQGKVELWRLFGLGAAGTNMVAALRGGSRLRHSSPDFINMNHESNLELSQTTHWIQFAVF